MKYKESGVDIDKGVNVINRIKRYVKSTYSNNVLSKIGNFGSLYNGLFHDIKEPILVSSIDGVGTKLIIAEKSNYFVHIGEDIVNHCVNDILAVGAKPLYFLDYIGCGKLDEGIVETIIKSMSNACKENDMSLIGGELAEMSVVYNNIHYDVVGSITGVCEKKHILTGKSIEEDNIIIGLSSSGFHTNGYSLIRKIIDDNGIDIMKKYDKFQYPLYKELLIPHRSYFKQVYPLICKGGLNGIAHITGGGFFDNVNRILPNNIDAIIEINKFKIPYIFNFFIEKGNIDRNEAFRVFNMGIGMMLFVKKDNIKVIEKSLKNIKYYIIGYTKAGNGKVIFK